MKRITSAKVVDLGVASRETKGGALGTVDISGRQPGFGLTND